MESDDLLVTLGLSSYWSDLRESWVANFESMPRMEIFESGKTVSAYLIRISQFRINSKDPGSRRGEI